MSRLLRRIAPLVLGVALTTTVARAQELGPVDEGAATESEGNPLYGYLATAALGSVAILILCKSSRR